jgi:hypothetical protein
MIVWWLGALWPQRDPVKRYFKTRDGIPAWIEQRVMTGTYVATKLQSYTEEIGSWIGEELKDRHPRPKLPGGASREEIVESDKAYRFEFNLRRYVLLSLYTAVVAILIPWAVFMALGRGFRDMGLGPPNRLGWRIILVGYLIALPFVAVMSLDGEFAKFLWRTVEPNFWVAMGLYTWILFPEHISFHGWVLAALIPMRRLSVVTICRPSDPGWRRGLQWVGLAQPASGDGKRRILDWLGMERGVLLAIVLSGIHFGFAHLGKPLVEVMFSVPGGMGLAYLAYRSRSLWTPFILHALTGSTALLIVWLRVAVFK